MIGGVVIYVSQVLGGFEASDYVTERKWASASDGTQIPISIVYRKDIVKLDGSDPLLLYGYGSYEVTEEFVRKFFCCCFFFTDIIVIVA